LDIFFYVLCIPLFTWLSLILIHRIITHDNADNFNDNTGGSALALLAKTVVVVHVTLVHNSPLEEVTATYRMFLEML
jgi:hypothetical protein